MEGSFNGIPMSFETFITIIFSLLARGLIIYVLLVVYSSSRVTKNSDRWLFYPNSSDFQIFTVQHYQGKKYREVARSIRTTISFYHRNPKPVN